MKVNLSLPLILLLAILASCSGGSGDLDKYGLKGNVKKVEELQALNRHDPAGPEAQHGQHGNRQLNKLLMDKIGLNRMMLHASEIAFKHPEKDEKVIFNCELPEMFRQLL